ncbi:nitroreductase family protein [Micromonospora sp. WMMD1128]|uniref:Acg family FMN-binding oxidoreductase n=1 Tax=Micromonospora sp. WMMD1128 TaxID=3015150 RepID=UPI00248C6F24|nr:nitroreductase family protein [Micromonospora sp. WMMD1128]WBB72030.1 nitroreductase family protein [Micromonospora sp. WMMD1128]
MGYTVRQLRGAVADAVRAPSLHNTQPWRFRLRDGGIEVTVDPRRALPATDPTGWGARVACGAALFNLRLALAVAGTPATVRLRPYPTDPDVVARLEPDVPRRPTPTEQSLHGAIARRFSNRAPFWPDPVPAEARWRLGEAARAEQCWLELVIGASAVNALAEVARSAHRVLERDPAYVAERVDWMRSEPAPDGVPAAAGGPQSEPQDLLPQRGFGGRNRAPGRDFEPEPLVAVLGTPGNTGTDQVVAGQALQRVLLTATDAGLGASLLSQPIEVPAAREALRLSLGRFGTPQMVMRIGYGQPGRATPRRPVDEVLDLPVVPA